MILENLRLANLQSSSDLAPVITILPLLKMRPVVLGFLSLMITAANRLGLYQVAFPFQVISLRSSLQSKSTVPTTFCTLGRASSGIFWFLICCCCSEWKSVMKETVEKQPEVDLKKQASYTYWVDNKNKSRELPPEQKPQKVEVPLQKENATHKSVWNTCGTWEEKKVLLADLKAQYEPKILAWIEETGVTFKFESLTLDGDCHLVSKRNKVSLMYDLSGCISFTGTGKKCQFSIEELTDHGDRNYSIKADNTEEKQALAKHANTLIIMLEEILSLYKQTE